MPQDKDIKKLVRERMVETGERYTDAKTAIDTRGRPEATTVPATGEPTAQELIDRYFRDWGEWLRMVVAEGRLGRNNARWALDQPRPPVDAARWGALHHPNARRRRDCLSILDHHANDESVDIFRAALRDPVPRVRQFALHGLACERCRVSDLCVADVSADLVVTLESDSSPKVRHSAVQVLARLMGRDGRILEALERAATSDQDELVRRVSLAALKGDRREVKTRKALRRRDRRLDATRESG
jgi:hypothetical protein